jgi:hypothetical protein
MDDSSATESAIKELNNSVTESCGVLGQVAPVSVVRHGRIVLFADLDALNNSLAQGPCCPVGKPK